MSYIVVYFATGEVIDFTDVVNRRRVWRRVSKACKRWGSRVDRVVELRGVGATDLNAWARKNLSMIRWIIGKDVLYMDTDSIKIL